MAGIFGSFPGNGQTLSIARTIVGPLTTTFTAPSSCSVPYINGNVEPSGRIFFGSTCSTATGSGEGTSTSVYVDPSCLPSNIGSGTITSSPTLTLFSPGIVCPQGWSSDFGISSGTRDSGGYGGLWPLLPLLNPDESVIVCCATGFTAFISATDTTGDLIPTPDCIKTLQPGDAYTGTSYTLDCSTVTETGTPSATVFEYQSAVNLLLGPTDRFVGNTSTPTSSPTGCLDLFGDPGSCHCTTQNGKPSMYTSRGQLFGVGPGPCSSTLMSTSMPTSASTGSTAGASVMSGSAMPAATQGGGCARAGVPLKHVFGIVLATMYFSQSLFH